MIYAVNVVEYNKISVSGLYDDLDRAREVFTDLWVKNLPEYLEWDDISDYGKEEATELGFTNIDNGCIQIVAYEGVE